MAEGRQDIQSPDATVEKSDPTPVDQKRGQRLWLGVVFVAFVFIAIIVIVAVTH